MLEFLYTGDYDDVAFCHEENYEAVRLNMLVHIAAVKYDLPELATLASEGFCDRAWDAWRFPEFAAVVEELYEFPMDPKQQGLRNTVVEVCVAHAAEIFAAQEQPAHSEDLKIYLRHHPIITHPVDRDPNELRDFVKSVPCFGGDLAAELSRKLSLTLT